MPVGDKCWVDYAEKLRRRMYREGIFELTVPTEEVHADTGTDVPLSELKKPGYWNPVRDAKNDWDTLPRNGILVDFTVNDEGKVDSVTFKLDESRSEHLRRVLERNAGG
jgi:hypothetical protein